MKPDAQRPVNIGRVPAGRRRCAGFSRAFTLIELLVVTAILGLVVGVIGASLSAGLRAWDAARTFQTVEADAAMALRMLHRDVMNTFPFYGIPFQGASHEFTCATLIQTSSTSGSESEPRVGSVRYSFAARDGLLSRANWVYPGDAPKGSQPETLARSVESMAVDYATADGTWLSAWADATNTPAAVRVSLVVKGSDRSVSLSETIVPVIHSKTGGK